ncbi:hypothetical protein MCC93_17970 [Morococcus cerebrosus]|uniref:Uncharacterized protein n=2 Tax=Neisseriaceae TaxID=481 RepID=A0A0C1EDF9_9NEIS|nr:hypothetical protein HMPREF1051_1967 [Neisseria sicca VK64]KIC06833.1 hypothetical protein MCC93_17970 [Morococcus cerebrosus]
MAHDNSSDLKGVIKNTLTVETPPFGAVESETVWEKCNLFQIRAIHRAALCV